MRPPSSQTAEPLRTAADMPSHIMAGPMIPLLAWAGCALFALSIPPIPDHAYQFHIASRYLDGARLYVDVAAADMHPPLFTWLAALFVSFGRLTGAHPLALYSAAVSVMIAASMYAVTRLRPMSTLGAVIWIFALMSMAGPFFGQGDHLAVILPLPYLAAAAARLDGVTLRRRSRLVIAVVAAIGMAMKPHFALVWLGVEGYIAIRQGWRSLLRMEALVIGALFALYVAVTAIATPEFFAIVQWALELYPRFAPVPLSSLLFSVSALPFVAGLVAGRLAARRGDTNLPDVLSIAMIAMFVAAVLQGKGWGYHWYPVNVLAVLLVGLAIVRAIRPAPRSASITVGAAALLAVASVFVMNMQIGRTVALLVGPPSFLPRMLETTERHAAGGPVIALSHTLNVAFPLVNLTDTEWPLPYAHLWMVPAIYDDAWAGRERFRYRQTGRWAALEQTMFDNAWTAMERNPDAMIILPAPFDNGFDMHAYFATDVRIAARLAAMNVVDTVGYYMILKPR